MVPVEITIVDDSFFEVMESFTVRLVPDCNNPTVMVNPDTAVVLIYDGKLDLCALQLAITFLREAPPTTTSQYSLRAM